MEQEKKFKQTMKYIIYIVILFTAYSCMGESSKTCEWEINNYKEKWDYVVSKTYRSPQYNATFIIKTINRKEIYFQPIQGIVSQVEPGDRIIKEPYSKYAFWINSDNDTLRSRIFSVSCDSIVLRSFKYRENKGIQFPKLHAHLTKQ